MNDSLAQLERDVHACHRCPRLRRHCVDTAEVKRRAYLEWDYWGKPISGYGDPAARLWVIGLAPAAHGANRTGRVFTGDRSGDFLFAALHRVGFASQPFSSHRGDGMTLKDCFISAAVRCAPPENKPHPAEAARCAPFLDREWNLLSNKRLLLALGKFAWDATLTLARRNGCSIAPGNAFGHGAICTLTNDLTLLGSYHVSQQNTFTGRLTEKMFDDVLRRAISFFGTSAG